MKINTIAIYSCLLLLVCFSSCKNEEKDTTDAQASSLTENQDPIINERGLQVFEGQIDNKYDVIMEVNLKENPVRGELIYKSVGVPILLQGGLNDNFLELKEVINGSSNAKLAGELSSRAYTGTWVKSGSSQKLPLEMKASDSDFSSFINQEKMNEINITGTYQMPQKEGSTASYEIRLNYKEGNQVEFLLQGNRGAPNYNQGFLVGIGEYSNNQINYTDKEMDGCSFTITLTPTGLEISCQDDKCGFGANVRMSGEYKKISYEQPEIDFSGDAGAK